jgi:DNA-binding phage protein
MADYPEVGWKASSGLFNCYTLDKYWLMKELIKTVREEVDYRIGVTELSRRTGLGRESLYKTLSGKRDIKLSTLLKILDAIGYEIKFEKKDP